MLSVEFVLRKLQLITDDLARLQTYREVTHDQLTDDFVIQATVERLLERIIMRAIDVNRHLLINAHVRPAAQTASLGYRETFHRLAATAVLPEEFAKEIGRSAGLRNVLVHDYNDADHRLLHASINACLDQYPRYVQYVRTYLDRPGPT